MLRSISLPAFLFAFNLSYASEISAQPPQLVSQDSLVVMGDSLEPFALLNGGDRIYTPVRNMSGDNHFNLVRATSDGFRVWSSSVAFQGYLQIYRTMFSGSDGAAYFHYQSDNGYKSIRIDRTGSPGPETTLLSGLNDNWSFWKPIGGSADTIAAGGPRSSPEGICAINVFTYSGQPLRQVTLEKPVSEGRSIAIGERSNLLLVEWESTDIVRKLYLQKIDSKGASLWRKPFDGGPDGDITAILTVSDGYLVAGYMKSTGPDNYDAWLFKIDFDGVLKWRKVWGDRWNDKINTIIACRNGGYLLGGHTTVFGSKKELRGALWRVNGDGDTSWCLHLPPYSVTNLVEPVPGEFHLFGISSGQKKWFAILGPENPASLRISARRKSQTHAEKFARVILLPAGKLPRTLASGYKFYCARPDGRTVGVLQGRDRVTDQILDPATIKGDRP